MLNTTYCKLQCPYLPNENAVSLSCEPCKKAISYFQILDSNPKNKIHCMKINNVVNTESEIDSAYFFDRQSKVKFSYQAYKDLKHEINWFQIGILCAIGAILLTFIIIGILTVRNYCNNKKYKKNRNNYVDEHKGRRYLFACQTHLIFFYILALNCDE